MLESADSSSGRGFAGGGRTPGSSTEGFDMPHDLAIPGGTLHDGTGAPGQTGEVAVVRGELTRARSGWVIRSA
jgi:hypothetical protein